MRAGERFFVAALLRMTAGRPEWQRELRALDVGKGEILRRCAPQNDNVVRMFLAMADEGRGEILRRCAPQNDNRKARMAKGAQGFRCGQGRDSSSLRDSE
jgi:hypothetical protein